MRYQIEISPSAFEMLKQVKEADKKDIYTLAQKLLRARLLDPAPTEQPAEEAAQTDNDQA